MKTLIFILLSTVCSYSQVTLSYCQNYRIRVMDDKTRKFSDWSPWTPTDLFITFNKQLNMITVHGNRLMEYTITSTFTRTVKDDLEIMSATAVDEEDIPCIVQFVNSPNGRFVHFYVRWRNLEIVYELQSN